MDTLTRLKIKSMIRRNWAPKFQMKIRRRSKRMVTKRFPGWKKTRKPKVKNSKLKRKNWRMWFSPLSLNCTNREADPHPQVAKAAKKTLTRTSCNQNKLAFVSSFLVSSLHAFHVVSDYISNIYEIKKKTFLRDLDLHQAQVQRTPTKCTTECEVRVFVIRMYAEVNTISSFVAFLK